MWLGSGAGGGCCEHNRVIVVKRIVIASLIIMTVEVPGENRNVCKFLQLLQLI
jgi:hypothetical protein